MTFGGPSGDQHADGLPRGFTAPSPRRIAARQGTSISWAAVMKNSPTALEGAYEIAFRLDYDTEGGCLEASACPDCHEGVFVVRVRNSDGVTAYGYGMNPGCGYERSAA